MRGIITVFGWSQYELLSSRLLGPRVPLRCPRPPPPRRRLRSRVPSAADRGVSDHRHGQESASRRSGRGGLDPDGLRALLVARTVAPAFLAFRASPGRALGSGRGLHGSAPPSGGSPSPAVPFPPH